MNGQQQQEGEGQYGNGLPRSAPTANGLRVPSVQEALTYTPFTSIFPFSPGRSPFTSFQSVCVTSR